MFSITAQTFSLPVCLVGALDSSDQLLHHLNTLGFDSILEYHFDFFDVESAHELASQLAQKSDNTTCIIYHISRTNIESQNTLLKSLEDYGGNIALILHIPNENIFLPTIHSRCHRIDIRKGLKNQTSEIDWINWLTFDSAKRIEHLKDLELPELKVGIDLLEQYFHTQLLDKQQGAQQLKKIQKVRSWLNSPNPSASMVGEFLSLTI